MEYYLMTDIDMWFSIIEGFEMQMNESGTFIKFKNQIEDMKNKEQSKAKVTTIHKCGLTPK